MELTLNVVADVVMDTKTLDDMIGQMSVQDMRTLARILTARANVKETLELADSLTD